MADALREAVLANSRLRRRHAEAVESASNGIARLAEMLADANAEIERLSAELAQAMAERGRALTVADALEQQIEHGHDAQSALDHMHAKCASDVKRAFAGYASAPDPAA